VRTRGRGASDEVLIQRVWGYFGEVDRTALKNVVYRLCRKIEVDPARRAIIRTVPDAGYQLTREQ